MAYKSKSTKFGSGRRTITYNSNGKSRVTYSHRAGNQTFSTSTSGGKTRRTVTTKRAGGWIERKSSTLVSAPRKRQSTSTRRRSYRSNNDAEISFAFIGAFFAAIWWVIVSSFKALGFIYKTLAALTEPRESKIKFHAIVTLKFIGLIYMIALISYAIWSFQ